MDFYLSICDKVEIIGYAMENLKLLDVGKCDTLEKAEDLLNQIE